ncbi:hypothetical protein J6590_093635 [Homalodisca vitripennis]|nr:hypothetical protein J6590_093635 [Homalodisca vitripennis]
MAHTVDAPRRAEPRRLLEIIPSAPRPPRNNSAARTLGRSRAEFVPLGRRGAARRVYSVRRQRNRFLAAVTFGCLRTTSAIVELEAISGSYNTAHSFLRADPTPTAVPFQTTQYMPQLPSPIGQMGQYPGAQEGRFAVAPDGSRKEFGAPSAPSMCDGQRNFPKGGAVRRGAARLQCAPCLTALPLLYSYSSDINEYLQKELPELVQPFW